MNHNHHSIRRAIRTASRGPDSGGRQARGAKTRHASRYAPAGRQSGVYAHCRGRGFASRRCRSRRRQRGFTMLELLVVVGILSGLSVTLYGVISVTQSAARVNQAVQDVQMIRGAAGSWVSGRTTLYNDISMAKLKPFLPKRMHNSATSAVANTANPWGGELRGEGEEHDRNPARSPLP